MWPVMGSCIIFVLVLPGIGSTRAGAQDSMETRPWRDPADSESVIRLIRALKDEHGQRYTQANQHASRLPHLVARRASPHDDLTRLQRDVLLFDTLQQMLRQTPRIDMPGGQPSLSVSRVCK